MDVSSFSREDIVLHLAQLGYSNITEQKLDSFTKDLRKLIRHEERKKVVEDRLEKLGGGDLSSRSEPSLYRAREPQDSSTTPEQQRPARRRVRRKDKKARAEAVEEAGEDDSSLAEKVGRDTPDGGQSEASGQSSLYIDVELPGRQEDGDKKQPVLPEASLLVRPPSSGPGFIRVRSGPSLGRRPASSDPVALHQQYRKQWAAHPVPGESSHNRLRWAVRGWMMGEEPL